MSTHVANACSLQVARMQGSALLRMQGAVICEGPCIVQLMPSVPQVDTASPARSGLAWHPDGSLLAVAGPSHDVVLYERLSWDPVVHLEEGHSGDVDCLHFSPNGAHTLPPSDHRWCMWDYIRAHAWLP